jgi:hypothetical protein
MSACDAASAFRAAIVATLGHAPAVIEPGRLHRFATSARAGDLAGWCRLFADQRGGVFGCHRLGIREAWRAAEDGPSTREQRLRTARQAIAAAEARHRHQRQQWAKAGERIERLWAECMPLVAGGPVTRYLHGRGRGLGRKRPLPYVLRLHPALPYWQDGQLVCTYAAMVAPLQDPYGRIIALHRTYVTDDGAKAPVPHPKRVTPAAGPLAGACIRLHTPVRETIGIAEGIETALAAAEASGVPTVAAYCASSLAAWQWPPGVRRLVIFADADPAGRQAADDLRRRGLVHGLAVDVVTPSERGSDWCDVWAARDGALIEACAR